MLSISLRVRDFTFDTLRRINFQEKKSFTKFNGLKMQPQTSVTAHDP